MQASLEVALTAAQRDELRRILQHHLPGVPVLAFGSRATGRGLKPHSDLDLLIQADAPLPLRRRRQLVEALEDSSLPFRVDIVEQADLDAAFLDAILPDAVSL